MFTAPRNSAFRGAFKDIVRRLCGSERADTPETFHLVLGIIGHPDGADFPFLLEFQHRFSGFFDGDERVGPMYLVKVDVIRLQTPERSLDLLEDSFASCDSKYSVAAPFKADLRGNDHLLTTAALSHCPA